MKKIWALILCLSCLFGLASCSFGNETGKESQSESEKESESEIEEQEEGNVIKYGVPALDGLLDEMYLESFSYTEEPLKNLNYSGLGMDEAKKQMKNTQGTAYYLFDEDYLYVCCVIHDETLCTLGKDKRMNTKWPWDDDAAEIYISFLNDRNFAIHCDPFEYRAVVDEHISGDNHTSSQKYHDMSMDDWAASIDRQNQNYTIEIRIELPDDITEGSTIGTLLEIDDRWGYDDSEGRMVGALFAMPRDVSKENFHVQLGKFPKR